MNENTPIIPIQVPPAPDPVATDMDKLKSLLLKIKSKFNKKTLIIIGVVFGIFLLLVVIISTVSKNLKNIVVPKPTPIINSQDITDNKPVSTVSGELAPNQIQLIELKKQINELDVEQSRLLPPNINFKIDFSAKK